MLERIRQFYRDSRLEVKIRYLSLILLFPMCILFVYCFFNLWIGNKNFENMLISSVLASDFSLDFKKDFDYEAYLLIVGNKSPEDSKIGDLLTQANRIADSLENRTADANNEARLVSLKKYLSNLSTYVERIKENLKEDDRYEDNLEIWENDIQIVTTLVQNTMSEYIYYEIRGIQKSREEYQESYISTLRFTIVAFIVISIVIAVLTVLIPLSITKPITELSRVMDRVARGDLTVRADFDKGPEVTALSNSLNTMIDKINELLNQVTEEQTRLRKAEFEVLQAQINPHFLYNTLDAIVWLAEAGEYKKVVGMVGDLSEFFRTSLNHGRDIVTIHDELQHINSYLKIQKVRYQDILEYDIQVPAELYGYLIPKITLQPLVENALYHGIKNKRGCGCIAINGRMEGELLILSIADNGIGMTTEKLEQLKEELCREKEGERTIYGMYNVNERIRLNFGEQYGLRIQSTYKKGSLVEIVLPCRLPDQEKNQLSSYKNEPKV